MSGPDGVNATRGLEKRTERRRPRRGLAHFRVSEKVMNHAARPVSAPRVLVVDDQPAFRAAARRLLERRGYDVVAEASCAATALDAVERLAPQAVLLDVRLGDDDGFEVCRRLTRARPGLAVLLASTSEREEYDELAMSSGARGFVNKVRLLTIDFGQFWPRADRAAHAAGRL